MKLSATAITAFLAAAYSTVDAAPAPDNILAKPHKVQSKHMVVCIPDLDLLACEKNQDGSDGKPIEWQMLCFFDEDLPLT